MHRIDVGGGCKDGGRRGRILSGLREEMGISHAHAGGRVLRSIHLFVAGRSVLQRADRKFCIFGHCHRNLSMEAGRLLSAAYERLSAGYYGLRNHTKACKADAYHKMGYAFSSHRNDSCNNTGVAARNCAPSDIADNYQFYLRHAV